MSTSRAKQEYVRGTTLLNGANIDNFTFQMATATLATDRIVAGIVVAVLVLLEFGFVIGWVSVPNDEYCSSKKYMKYIVNERKEDMKMATCFHEKMFEILNADKIGKDLR